MNLAPIALFVYNRPKHLSQVIQALRGNIFASSSELFIFSDGPKNEKDKSLVDEVRKITKSVEGFKKVEVIERERNFGLAQNIINGVTSIISMSERIIVLEDDLITSPFFLKYINEALNIYENDNDVISIHGYVYPIKGLPETFFMKGADCLGWATWRRGWELFEEDSSLLLEKLINKNKTFEFDFNSSYPYTNMLKDQLNGFNYSWAIKWYASAFILDKYTLYPGKSLIYHSGNDGSGTNTDKSKKLDVDLYNNPIILRRIDIRQDPENFYKFVKYFRGENQYIPAILKKLKRVLLEYFYKFKKI